MAKRDRLGRGLSALLGDYAGADGVRLQTRMLPIESISPNPFQPRREFDPTELAELAASIRENGLLQPILVRPQQGDSRRWELVTGERRWRACSELGWNEIPAMVREVDDRTLLVLALVENLQREELSPLEEAEGFKRLAEEFSLTQQQIAEVVGRDRSTVANALRLLQLPVSVRQLLAAGSLTAGHARALLGLTDPKRMGALGRRAAEEGWSVREVEARVQKARPARRATRVARPRDAAERALEEELQRAFGTAARIRVTRGTRGRIEIPFYGAEDFERVFELLTHRSPADVVS